ncbi:MAG: winged helix-turn-helix domain-containing protein [Actinomycetota bacterium]|nr:winged helix-turn-helix domain-containing protein [Actinomycetota bacterium]
MTRRWTFLSNHGLVFLAVARDPTATQREIADAVGITERAAQRLIADLVDAGYLRKIAEGRRNRYEIATEAPLRHPLNSENDISELLGLLGTPGRKG